MDTDPLPATAQQTAQATDTHTGERAFVARRRRLRNRWNVQMRKDHRAQDRAARRDTPLVSDPAETPAI